MRRIAVLAASLLALAACGGGGGGEAGSDAPAATATTAAATTTTVSVAADKATARALVLKPSDLPAGWKATPHRADPTDKAFDRELAACLGRPSPDTYITASADSPDFSLNNAEISSQAQIVKTDADFDADVEAVKGSKYLPCVKRLVTKSLQKQVGAGASVQSVTVARRPAPDLADFSAAFRATIKVLVQGQTVNVYQDAVLLGKGRIELTADFTDVQQPPDPDLEKTLLDKLSARLEAA